MRDTDFCSYIAEKINEEVKNGCAEILSENEQLKNEILEHETTIMILRDEITSLKEAVQGSDMMLCLLKNMLKNIKSKDKETQAKQIYQLLNSVFEPDFSESTYDCPLWLGALTNFYSNKDLVIDFLRCLNITMPDNVKNFRLPQDWTEAELDIVFSTMGRHYVCNNCIYKDNMQFWKANAMMPVEELCKKSIYTEIPWQFLLRNPNLLKEKYLVKIGQMAFEETHVGGWRYLFNIHKYQNMSSKQLQTIIENVNPHGALKKEGNPVSSFLLSHVNLITCNALLDNIYTTFYQTYEFKSKNIILNMPEEYLYRWIKDVYVSDEWIKNNLTHLDKEKKLKIHEILVNNMLELD